MTNNEKLSPVISGPGADPQEVIEALRQEIGRLRLEIARLKRQLPAAHGANEFSLVSPSSAMNRSPGIRESLKDMAPRLRQTFELLLTGETERAISQRMSISVHTLHDYVKGVYSHCGVSSRSTLIAWYAQQANDRRMKQAPRKPHSHPTAKAERFEQQFQELPSGLTYQEIAQRLGISYPIARAWAKRLDYPARCLPRGRPSGREQRVNQMLGLPEDLTVVQVAQRLKISVTVAYYWIRQTGYQFRRAPGSGRWNEKVVRDRWSNVDWSLSNIEIAKSVGVSRERVRQVRAQHDTPNGGS